MEKAAFAGLSATDFRYQRYFLQRHAEMRYRGQRHNIKIPVSGLTEYRSDSGAFERDYKRRYGHADSKAAPRNSQALHLSAFARLNSPKSRACRERGEIRRDARQFRRVYFGNAGGALSAQIFDRDRA